MFLNLSIQIILIRIKLKYRSVNSTSGLADVPDNNTLGTFETILHISPAVCRTHILLRLVCSSGGIALILSLTGVIGIWWWVGQNRTQPLLFGLLILPAWDIIDPAVSDRKWIDCGPLTLHIGCFHWTRGYKKLISIGLFLAYAIAFLQILSKF